MFKIVFIEYILVYLVFILMILLFMDIVDENDKQIILGIFIYFSIVLFMVMLYYFVPV